MTDHVRQQLAWDLIDWCRLRMRGPELQLLFVLLGADEHDEAIVSALNGLHRRKMDVPDELRDQLRAWAGHNHLQPYQDASLAVAALRNAPCLGVHDQPHLRKRNT